MQLLIFVAFKPLQIYLCGVGHCLALLNSCVCATRIIICFEIIKFVVICHQMVTEGREVIRIFGRNGREIILLFHE